MENNSSTDPDFQSVASKESHSTPVSSGGGSASRSDGFSQHAYSPPVVGKREETNVLRARALVALILLLAVSGVATAANLLVKKQEQDDFENKFEKYAAQVVTVSRSKVDQFLDALDSFASSIGAAAAAEHALVNTSWPFYSVPEWSIQAQKIARITSDNNSMIMTLIPIVKEDERDQWRTFAAEQNPLWYQESIENEGYTDMTAQELLNMTVPFVYFYDPGNNFYPSPVSRPGEVLPIFQTYPVGPITGLPIPLGNLEALLASKQTEELYRLTNATRRPSVGFTQIPIKWGTTVQGCRIIQPVFDGASTESDKNEMVALLAVSIPWLEFFNNLLVEGDDGIVVVLESACPQSLELNGIFLDKNQTVTERNVITYQIDGPNTVFLGETDLHDPEYDALAVSEIFLSLGIDQSLLPEGTCVPELTLHVYPSKKLERSSQTDNSTIYTVVVVVIFVFTTLVFLLYDFFVGRRQRAALDRIAKQDRIVSDVFPAAIRNRLFENHQAKKKMRNESDLLEDDEPFGLDDFGRSSRNGSAPLADLFPSVTVVFADLVGFTAWSSAREPHQVFILLETIYGAFDRIAYRHSVFKVETVGDCYVAAAGLPEPTDDHGVVACRFARDCIKKLKDVTLKLEVSLGPDTSELEVRIGIHSGQVTAGVLRGQRSRFQLFGDTMNKAARMESSGEPNRIQVSQVTANLLAEAGLNRWIIPRSTKVFVKGKGEVQTYWLTKSSKSKTTKPRDVKTELGTQETELETLGEGSESEEMSSDKTEKTEDEDFLGVEGMNKTQRLVEWNVEILTSLLEQILGCRGEGADQIQTLSNDAKRKNGTGGGKTVLEEFTPIIHLKRFDTEEIKRRGRPKSMNIGDEAKSQLRNYISSISGMYPDNAFHNFEHASHVTASVKKLLARIVNTHGGNGLGVHIPFDSGEDTVDLAGHSYGITSDPLTQFAVVFSAVIHDVLHPGVPNTQLVKENSRWAQLYKKSIAEQKSVDMAWDLLMEDDFAALRACIYQTEEDFQRFRQLVVNTVLATDIVDKELQALRKARWETAFSKDETGEASNDTSVESEDRKATIVIEHLIQASDVSHTMQHWHIYKKWNERFFMECYAAYKEGRADSDPSQNWYKGEIGFFDYYIIPLAKKLQSCGVFGVSSDEYLNYARANREEWVREGEALVRQYLLKFKERNSKLAPASEQAPSTSLLE